MVSGNLLAESTTLKVLLTLSLLFLSSHFFSTAFTSRWIFALSDFSFFISSSISFFFFSDLSTCFFNILISSLRSSKFWKFSLKLQKWIRWFYSQWHRKWPWDRKWCKHTWMWPSVSDRTIFECGNPTQQLKRHILVFFITSGPKDTSGWPKITKLQTIWVSNKSRDEVICYRETPYIGYIGYWPYHWYKVEITNVEFLHHDDLPTYVRTIQLVLSLLWLPFALKQFPFSSNEHLWSLPRHHVVR